MDDREAVEKTLDGSVEAFGCLVSRYESKVYAVALARVFDHQDAQDLCQEAFLRAYVRLPMLKNSDAFAPWLFMILRRLSVDFLRGRWRKDRMREKVLQSDQEAESPTDPRHRIDTADVAQTLWARVAQLDDRSREVLSLHYVQDMKVREIAELTGLRESAVKMRIRRARSILGDRIGDLKGAWGIAPLPAFAGGITKALTAVGPLKGGIAAGSFLGGLFAVLGSLWWSATSDLNRWQNHAPEGMVKEGKRAIVRGVLYFAAVMLLAPLIAFAVALALPLAHSPAATVPDWVRHGAVAVYCAVLITLFGAVVKRETDLLSPRERLKQFVNIAAVIAMFATTTWLPAFGLGAMGLVLALQYFFINKSDVALGVVPPGIWVGPLLTRGAAPEVKKSPIAKQQIKTWLTILHGYGLVAPPLVNETVGYSVRLRVRGSLFEKMAYGPANSSLAVDMQGVASCTITPRDYVALAKHLDIEVLPGRQELAKSLGLAFTNALVAYTEGGGRAAVADSLGLVQCPIDPAKSYRFMLLRYVLPLVGVVIMAVSLFRLLT
ncbi:MAG: sigma-70 family RNA polymerase sigma factor [Candidatus Hydrogenedentes bacterium]|nr:sigma-70 family RNA polymerase sigma factor [Candidatus Hydrogenedentota bacterium]